MEKLSQTTSRYIEEELYDYENTLMLIQCLESDIIYDPSIDYSNERVMTSKKVGSAVEEKAMKLIQLKTNKQLAKAIRTKEAIDRAIMRMSEEEKKFHQLKYINCYHRDDIMEKHLCISRSTYFRLKEKVISKVGNEMGF